MGRKEQPRAPGECEPQLPVNFKAKKGTHIGASFSFLGMDGMSRVTQASKDRIGQQDTCSISLDVTN